MQLTSYVGGFKPHASQASTCSSFGSSNTWLRHPCFGVYRKIAWKLLMRHFIVILGLKLHENRCSLARGTGHFPPTGASASWKWTTVSERSGVAQSKFWTRSMRFNKSRPGGCSCQRPYLRVHSYLLKSQPVWSRSNLVNSSYVLWYNKTRTKRITSDICLY